MNNNVVSAKNLCFTWPGSTEPVIKLDKFSIERGQHLFIQGPSGSGKTTLLNLLTGINRPDSGELQILDRDLTAMNSLQRDSFRADHLGVIFQQFNLLPFLTILENVILPCRFSARRHQLAGDVNQAARQVLMELQIDDSLLDRDVMDLSVGQQQRVAVARALIGNPEIIIADEPTSALDQANRDGFIELLFRRATEHRSTLIFVSHDEGLARHFKNRINLDHINQATMVNAS